MQWVAASHLSILGCLQNKEPNLLGQWMSLYTLHMYLIISKFNGKFGI